MKKTLALSLVVAMMACVMAGCGSSSSSGSSSTTTTAAPAETEAAAAEETEAEEAQPANSDLEPITLTLGHINPENDPGHEMAMRFAELVNEYTDGQVTVNVYANSELGTSTEELEGVRMGTQDILIEGYALLGNYSEYGMDNMPFLYDDYDHFMRCWYESEVGPKWIEYAEDAGFKVFGASYRGFRNVTSQKPFYDAAGVQGLKIRTPTSEPFVSTWTHLGAQATPMDLTETVTAIQQGTVEAQENPLNMSYNYGFADVCDYLIMTKHSCGANVFYMDLNRFNALPENVQEAIIEAAEIAAIECSEVNAADEESYIAKFEEKGCEVIYPDMDSFHEAFSTFVQDNFPQIEEIAEMIYAER